MNSNDPTAQHPEKRAYEPPQLLVYGDVKSLTAGGSGCDENSGTCGFLGGDP